MKTKTDTRTIEIEVSIGAPQSAVWKALTDPVELTRWFPPSAEVQPGQGGAIRLDWGGALRGLNTIRVWDPESHLATGWFEPGEVPAEEEPDTIFYRDHEARCRLAVDYFLEGRGGGTVLRLVHSGFSPDASWDEEVDSHRRGWTFELRSLRNYLEHHRGKQRRLAVVSKPVSQPIDRVWARLASEKALLAEGSFAGLAAGDRYALTTVHGDRFEGEVILVEAPVQVAGTVDNLDHSMMRVGVETWTGTTEATFWLSTWGETVRADAFAERWVQTLDEVFGR